MMSVDGFLNMNHRTQIAERGTTKHTNNTKEKIRVSLSLTTYFDKSHLTARGAGLCRLPGNFVSFVCFVVVWRISPSTFRLTERDRP